MASLTPPRSGTASRSRSPSPSGLSIRNLRLRVRAGPSYDPSTHVVVNVNDVEHPTSIDSEWFTGHIVVRVKDYDGVPGEKGVISEDEEYFKETRDTCSIMFGGWFHHKGKQWTAEDIVFGNDFDESIADKLPTGTSLGLKALRTIDPTLQTDLYSSKPWAYSPLLATMNTIHITSDSKPRTPKYNKLTRLTESTTLTPTDGAKTPPEGPITSPSDRRRHLASADARSATAFPSTYISGDFSNPFIDFNTFSVQLPYVGLKIDVLKYWTKGDKRQPLRYVCRLRPKDGEDEVVFFVVLFELVGDGVVQHDESMEGKQNGVHGEKATEAVNGKTNGPSGNKETDEDILGVD